MTLSQQILQYFITGVTIGSVYTLIGLGFNIIYNASEIINFAQGEFVMLGALLTISGVQLFHLPLPVAGVMATLAVALFGVIFDLAAIRPLKDASSITMIIITVGASIFIRGIASIVWGKEPYLMNAFSGEEPIPFFGAVLQPQSIWVMVVAFIIVMGLRQFFGKTLTGKAMMASAVQPRAARLVGIDVKYMVLLSFGLSGAVGSLAGIVIAPISMAQYDMGVILGLKGFCAAIIGGLGNPWGVVVGGISLGVLESMGAGLISSGYKDAIAFIILLLMLFFRPQGILGRTKGDRL
ncbi:MAG: branched-chain amino acid ABC transporter permease [Deltaproteobacteria bacterium]|nr:branched-chain amino acid ABC transporter permease [Deltaproteobacteria bacterium]